jgi:hypothetical protein
MILIRALIHGTNQNIRPEFSQLTTMSLEVLSTGLLGPMAHPSHSVREDKKDYGYKLETAFNEHLESHHHAGGI